MDSWPEECGSQYRFTHNYGVCFQNLSLDDTEPSQLQNKPADTDTSELILASGVVYAFS